MLCVVWWLRIFLPSRFSKTHHQDLFDLIFKLPDRVITALYSLKLMSKYSKITKVTT